MTNPVLPNGMRPAATGYSIDDQGGVMRTAVAGGMARYALEWDRGPQRYTITLFLTLLEFSVWSAFYHHTIRKGALTFDMPLDSGFGAALHAVNMIPGSYSAARTGGVSWVVTFVVEAENQVYDMTDVDAQALIDLYNEAGDDSNDLLARIAEFALTDTLVLTP